MPDEKTLDQRIWVLERDRDSIKDQLAQIIRLLEGTDARTGIKETLTDVQREVKRIARLSEQIETLEEMAVRKEEFKQMEVRLKALEDQRQINQGMRIGQRAMWGIISGAVVFVSIVLGLLLSIQSLASKAVGS